MKELLIDVIEREKQNIVALGSNLFENPELGYKEFKTREIVKEYIKYIKLTDYQDYAITGLKATIGTSGTHIGLLCDMDALPTQGHFYATNEDQAAHSCGHNGQITVMVGAFKAIYDSGILDKLGGRVSLILAPAEEFVDFDYRLNLIKERKIKAFSGKQNAIIEGIFDNIDVVLSSHGNGLEDNKIELNTSTNGFVAKTATFKGKSAHAGAYPHMGKNALNAALLSLQAAALLRETFQDDHHVRFHPIIKNGGTAVNTVPDKVVVETYVRAASVDAIIDANSKIDNAFIHSAKALGCECEIVKIPGYLPSNYYSALSKYIERNTENLIEKKDILNGGKTFASDDVADVSAIKPVFHFGYSGFCGTFHGADFGINDTNMAYIIPTKLIATTALDMLINKEEIKADLSKFKPSMKKEEYIKNWLGL